MTTQADALALAKRILTNAEIIRDDVRDMTDNDDAFGIVRHIEIIERNMRDLKAMLYSPDFHVNHGVIDPAADGSMALPHFTA